MNTFIRHGAYQYQVWRCDNNVYGRIAQLYMFNYVYFVCTSTLLSSNVVPLLAFSTCLHCLRLMSNMKIGTNAGTYYCYICFRPLSTNQPQWIHIPLRFLLWFVFFLSIVASLLRRLSCLLPSSLDWISSCPSSCVYFCRFMFLVSLPSCPCRVPFHNLFCLLVSPSPGAHQVYFWLLLHVLPKLPLCAIFLLMSWLSPSSQSKDLLQAVQTSWIRCLPYFFTWISIFYVEETQELIFLCNWYILSAQLIVNILCVSQLLYIHIYIRISQHIYIIASIVVLSPLSLSLLHL